MKENTLNNENQEEAVKQPLTGKNLAETIMMQAKLSLMKAAPKSTVNAGFKPKK